MMKRLRTLGVSPVIGLHPAMPGIRRQTEALRCWAGEFRESEAEQSGESDVFVPKASGSSAAPAAAGRLASARTLSREMVARGTSVL